MIATGITTSTFHGVTVYHTHDGQRPTLDTNTLRRLRYTDPAAAKALVDAWEAKEREEIAAAYAAAPAKTCTGCGAEYQGRNRRGLCPDCR